MAKSRQLYFTVSEVAQILGVCKQRVHELISEERFPNAFQPAGRPGTPWMIPAADMEHFQMFPHGRPRTRRKRKPA